MNTIRVLFLADTHLGFDLPLKPRINRRRRGIDFFKNYELALQSALTKEVDIVIHGGDLFYRSRIPNLLISMVFEPLIQLADSGIPIILVAGNHERSFIQQSIFDKHENIHVINELKSFYFNIKNTLVQISGFPCIRKNIRGEFKSILPKIDYKYMNSSHIHLLCMHQAVEGAKVGVQNYIFRSNHDTIRAEEIPDNFAAVLSGHIHRYQVLTHDLDGKIMKSQVYYPGSIERTSFAERNESKGYLIVDFDSNKKGGKIENYKFVELPTRPMKEIVFKVEKQSKIDILNEIINKVSEIDNNSIVRLEIVNSGNSNYFELPKIDEIRKILPASINISYKVD